MAWLTRARRVAGGFWRSRRWPVRILRIVVPAYVGACVVLTALQCRLAFYPMKNIEGDPSDLGLAFEDVYLTTEDGVKIHGWYVPADTQPTSQPGGAPAPPRQTLLFFHGNAGNISHRLESIAIFHRLDLNVLIIDYRGYGKSEGRPREQGTYRDAEAAWQYLTQQRNCRPEEIVIFGRSLGGAVAVELATRHTPSALIVESSFTSGPDMARALLPIFPKWLCFIRYDSLNRIRQVRCPVLIVHSRDDDLVPYKMGRKLYDAAPQPKEFFELEGGHNEGFLLAGEKYVDTLRAFLKKTQESSPEKTKTNIPE